jgi:hypothetical protein
MSFKVQIKDELYKNSWNIILIDSINEWWEDEHWQIQWRHSQGFKVYIQFLIDPMDTSRIWEVIAKSEIGNNQTTIASLSMGKRKFDIKLKEFISEIEKFRKNHENKNLE